MNRRDGIILAGLWSAAGACALLGHARDQRHSHYLPPARDPQGVRVVTWNVGDQDAGALDERNIGHIAAVLLRLDADIICLQELATRKHYDALRTALGGGYRGAVTRRDGRRVTILVRGTLEGREVPSSGGRNALSADVLLANDRSVRVGVIHADAFSAEQRNRDIGRIVDGLAGGDGPVPRILAGDLNLDLDLDKRRDLFSNNAHRDIESYNYITTQLFDTGIGRGATAEPDRRLDYIFTSADFGVRGAGPVKDQRTGGMDHDPVVADLVWVSRRQRAHEWGPVR